MRGIENDQTIKNHIIGCIDLLYFHAAILGDWMQQIQ